MVGVIDRDVIDRDVIELRVWKGVHAVNKSLSTRLAVKLVLLRLFALLYELSTGKRTSQRRIELSDVAEWKCEACKRHLQL